MGNIRALLALSLLIAMIFVGSYSTDDIQAAPPVPPGFTFEVFATGLNNPAGIAVAPPEFGTYGGDVFVANRNIFANPTGDWIARIDAEEGVSPFLTTGVYDPGNIAFGPGGDFGYEFYIGNNGAPGFQPSSNVLRVQADGSPASVLAVLALPEINSTNSSGGIAIDTSGLYDNDLFVGNTGGRDAIIRVNPTGNPTPFYIFDPPHEDWAPFALAFGNGNEFPQHLFIAVHRKSGSGLASGVYTLSPTGVLSSFVTSNDDNLIAGPGLGGLAFGPGGDFGTDLYLTDIVNGTILTISSQGSVQIFARGLDAPTGLAFDGTDSLYVAESSSNRILKIESGDPPTVSLPHLITEAIPGRATVRGATFFIDQFAVEYQGEQVFLSSALDGTGNTGVDDAIEIIVTHPDGSTAPPFVHDYSPGCMRVYPSEPIDLTDLFEPGLNTVFVRLYDICGSLVGSSPLYLGVPGQQGLALNITVILARDSNGPVPIRTAQYFEETLFPDVANYHSENSYGIVNLSLLEAKTDNGAYFALNLPDNFQAEEFIEKAIAAACGGEWCPVSDIVVVVHSGSSQQAIQLGIDSYGPTNLFTQTCTLSDPINCIGEHPWILVGETDPIGSWAHEIGHVLGLFKLTNDPSEPKTMLPHPTPIDAIEFWDLMADGGNACCDGIKPTDPEKKKLQGTQPTFMSSMSKHFLGLLDYEPKSKADTIAMGTRWITAQEISQNRVLRVDFDSTNCYVLEIRAKPPDDPNELGEEAIPESALVVYHINTLEGLTCGELTMIPGNEDTGESTNGNSEQIINKQAVIPSGGVMTDYGNNIRFIAADKDSTYETYRIQVRVESALNPLPETQMGIFMRGGQAIRRVLSIIPGIPSPNLESITMPDNDLHLYTDDGRHVGVNYTTGVFENQVENTDFSGNQFNGQEWIMIPDSTSGIHFIVSSLPTVQFLETFPELKSELGESDAVEIMGMAALPGDEPSNSGLTSVIIPLGSFVEVKVETVENPDGSLTVTLGQGAVTIDSLIAELDSYNAAGFIRTEDSYNGLRDKLVQAKIKIQKEDLTSVINQLKAFQNQLAANTLVEPLAREAIMDDSQALINALLGE